MKKLRDAMDPDTFRTLSALAGRRCMELDELRNAQTVHIYVSSVNREVHTHEIILALLDEGKRVIVPRCSPEPARLQHIRINSLDELKPARFGLLEPVHVPENEVAPAEFDLIIAPLLAFDRKGNRLGFGGGYYDYLFRHSHCPRIGLAYSFQETQSLPIEPHDRQLDTVVTEKEIIRCR